jgi:hypothetical protein
MSEVDNILNKLKDKPVLEIIEWMASNLNIEQLIGCLKEINPVDYDRFVQQNIQVPKSPQMSRVPINFPVAPESFDDVKMYVINITKKSNIIPIAIFPTCMYSTIKMKSKLVVDFSDVYNDRELKKSYKARKEIIDKVQKPIVDEIVNLIRDKITRSNLALGKIRERPFYTVIYAEKLPNGDISDYLNTGSITDITSRLKEKPNKIKSKSGFTAIKAYRYLYHFMEIYFKILQGAFDIKPNLMSITRYGSGGNTEIPSGIKLISGVGVGVTLIDRMIQPEAPNIENWNIDVFLMPYGLGDGWIQKPNQLYYPVHSERQLVGELDNYFDISKGKPWNVFTNSTCVLLAYDLSKSKPFLIQNYNQVGKPTNIQWKSEKELGDCVQLDIRSGIQKLNATSVTNDLNNFENKLLAAPYASRVYGEFTNTVQWENPGTTDLRFQDVNADVFLKRYVAEGSEPFTAATQDAMDKAINTIKTVNSISDSVDEGAIGAGASGPIRDIDSSFGRLQRVAAKRNVYITGARFGKSGLNFLTFMFDPSTQKWATDPKKKFNGKWKSETELKGMLSQSSSTTPTTKGIHNFFEMKDMKLNQSQFKFGKDYQLPPVHYSSFGYYQKAMEVMNKREQGPQLYPLGKYAYLKGPHAGVSATFSEADSRSLGLWPAPRMSKASGQNMSEFQFGQPKYASQFGKSKYASQFGRQLKTVKSPTKKTVKSPTKKTVKSHTKKTKQIVSLSKLTKLKKHSFGNAKPNDYSMVTSAYTGKLFPGIEKARYSFNGTQGTSAGFTGIVGRFPGFGNALKKVVKKNALKKVLKKNVTKRKTNKL